MATGSGEGTGGLTTGATRSGVSVGAGTGQPPAGLTGWLLDIYPVPAQLGGAETGAPQSDAQPGVIAWVLGDDGIRYRLALPFPVTFYAAGPAPRLRELWRFLRRGSTRVQLNKEERRELFSEQPVPVLAVRVDSPTVQSKLFYHVSNTYPDLTYFDADISVPLHAAARWGVFPLSRCRLLPDHSLQALDTPWELEPAIPPLRILRIMPDCDPHHAPPRSLEIRASVHGQPSIGGSDPEPG